MIKTILYQIPQRRLRRLLYPYIVSYHLEIVPKIDIKKFGSAKVDHTKQLFIRMSVSLFKIIYKRLFNLITKLLHIIRIACEKSATH